MDTGLWTIQSENGHFLVKNSGAFDFADIELPYSLGDSKLEITFSTEEKEKILKVLADGDFNFKLFPKMVYLNKNSTVVFSERN